MNKKIEFLLLDSIKRHGTFMPLFKSGYSYSKIMFWGKELENNNLIAFNEDGIRFLTDLGFERWSLLKKETHCFNILPLINYKTERINIDDIYLP